MAKVCANRCRLPGKIASRAGNWIKSAQIDETKIAAIIIPKRTVGVKLLSSSAAIPILEIMAASQIGFPV